MRNILAFLWKSSRYNWHMDCIFLFWQGRIALTLFWLECPYCTCSYLFYAVKLCICPSIFLDRSNNMTFHCKCIKYKYYVLRHKVMIMGLSEKVIGVPVRPENWKLIKWLINQSTIILKQIPKILFSYIYLTVVTMMNKFAFSTRGTESSYSWRNSCGISKKFPESCLWCCVELSKNGWENWRNCIFIHVSKNGPKVLTFFWREVMMQCNINVMASVKCGCLLAETQQTIRPQQQDE